MGHFEGSAHRDPGDPPRKEIPAGRPEEDSPDSEDGGAPDKGAEVFLVPCLRQEEEGRLPSNEELFQKGYRLLRRRAPGYRDDAPVEGVASQRRELPLRKGFEGTATSYEGKETGCRLPRRVDA